MATWDATELATQVLIELGILASGQSAAAEDVGKITRVYPSIYRRLRRAGVAGWSSTAIVDGAQFPLAQYIAGEVASSFGFSGNRLIEMERKGASGWIGLQEAASGTKQRASPKFLEY